MDDATKRRLYTLSELTDTPLAEAFREGAESFMQQRLTEQQLQRRTVEASDDPLLAEFRAVAANIERRLSGS